ncbi:MAG: translational GTPase TypA [Candidatus Omnitrophica bacterium CG02_land_8_20_14_3_00__42_8]|nr:MAG: translational GTPase TypA [Candidatus Omnitrophica bacterium CG02_land_8_20_14_3_00__42_8]
MTNQANIRNIAIIAHVDHGKTTLVDSILRQTHVDRNIEEMGECIMDSMDLERERGITIKAKNASVIYKNTKINIVDTPGHADFGGEVERTLRMVDGVLLLIDAKDGPMPQTRFVLRKALELGHKAIVVINKIDMAGARIDYAINRTFDLFCELDAAEEQLNFPIIYASALKGFATLDISKPSDNIFPLLDTILETIPKPVVNPDAPLQILVLSLLSDFYKGKMGIGKITAGSIAKGMNVILARRDKSRKLSKVTAILSYEGLKQIERESAESGEIVAVAGFEEIGIGDTITDANKPSPLDPPEIEKPTVRMMFGVNKSPFAGRDGKYVTSRSLRERLFKELETNVSLRVDETDSPDTFLVSGRGELHLAILIETMRREGYELQVSQPEAIFIEKDGIKMEPFEFLTIEVPSEYQGVVIEETGRRKASLKNMFQGSKGGVYFEYEISTRAVIGLKAMFMTKTRGAAIINHAFDEYEPMDESLSFVNSHGSLVSSEKGISTSYALNNAQERGELFIGPNVDVYEGMIIGQNSRPEDLDLSPCKTKKLTNMRAAGSDDAIILTPPKEMTLELSIEYLASDELLEVTPKNLRLRKKILDPLTRKRSKRRK